MPDQPWCSAAAASGLRPQEDLGGILPLPSSMELSPAPTGHRRESGESLGRGPTRRPPNPHPTGIRGGGRRASSGFCLFSHSGNAKVCGGGLWVGTPASFGRERGQTTGSGSGAAQKPARGLSRPAWVKAACASRSGLPASSLLLLPLPEPAPTLSPEPLMPSGFCFHSRLWIRSWEAGRKP